MKRLLPSLIALTAGLILFAADLPYILAACHGGFCNPYPFDSLILVFVLLKAIAVSGLLGWLAADAHRLLPGVFLIGSTPVFIEGVASTGLIYLQLLRGAPRASDVAAIPVDIAAGMVVGVWIAIVLGGAPAMLAASVRVRRSG
jgi:hypothetical protein